MRASGGRGRRRGSESQEDFLLSMEPISPPMRS